MKKKKLFHLFFFAALSSLSLTTFAQDYQAQAVRLSGRLTNGNPYSINPTSPDYAKLQRMVSYLQQGRAFDAAELVTRGEPDYLESLVPTLFAPLLNLNQDPTRTGMTDTMAMILGIVNEDRFFPSVLYDRGRYMITNKTFSTSSRLLYSSWTPAKATLMTDLVRIGDDGSDLLGYGIPSIDQSGILTTDGWGSEYVQDGTERRNIRGLIQFVGMNLEDIRSRNGTMDFIARDVNRVPDPFQPNLFFEFCMTCHYLIDAQRDAFLNLNYIMFVDSTGKGVASQKNGRLGINNTIFPGGWVTQTNTWRNTMPPEIASAFGWRGDNSGTGINSLGVAWSKTQSFYRSMANRAAQQLCPGVALDSATLDNLSSQFEVDGNFRFLTERVAILPQCLGS